MEHLNVVDDRTAERVRINPGDIKPLFSIPSLNTIFHSMAKMSPYQPWLPRIYVRHSLLYEKKPGLVW